MATATLDTSLDEKVDVGKFSVYSDARADAEDYINNCGYRIDPCCIVPDGTVTGAAADIYRPDFNIGNQRYFRFERRDGVSVFQIMWRVNKRYHPANAVIQTIDTSGNNNLWTGWSDWITENGTKDDPGEEIADVNINYSEDIAVWQHKFEHTYLEATTEYDCYNYQIRVRVYNAKENKCSNWSISSLSLLPVPSITGLSVTELSSTSWLVTAQTNYPRAVYVDLRNAMYYDSFTKTLKFLRNITPVSKEFKPIDKKETTTDSIAFIIPNSCIRNDKNGKPSAYFTVGSLASAEDRSIARWFSAGQPAQDENFYAKFQAGEHVEPELPEPVFTYDASSQHLTFYTASSGDNYNDVQVSVLWTGTDSTTHTEILETEYNEDLGKWVSVCNCPPLDIDLTIRVSVIGDDWAAHEIHLTIPSNGLLCFDGDLGSVRLKYNQSISTGDTIAGETIECVGREFPISRYGGVLNREIKLEATMLNSDILGGDGWKSNVEPLSGQADWILRIPGGEKYRVMVTSLDRNTENPTNNKLLSVSISCKVVGYE